MSQFTEALFQPPGASSPPGRALHLAGTLLLGVAALILGLLAALPVLAHRQALTWPVVEAAVVDRTVLTQHVNHKGPSYIVRDTYRLSAATGTSSCHWDDALGTGIRRWIDARLETRQSLWPLGSQVAVHAEPYGERCEPLGGYERAVRPTVAVVALAALAFLGAVPLLWRRPQAPR